MELPEPHRTYELQINIGADTWDDVVRELRWLATHIPEHGENCGSVSGSPSSNHNVRIRVDRTMSHERYFEDLTAYLAAMRRQRCAGRIGE